MNTLRKNATFGPRNLDSEHNACINYCGFNWPIVAEGFQNAANILAYKAQDQDAFLDDLVYPIAFNFRQAIELQLKICCFLADRLNSKKSLPPRGHDLKKLWRILKPSVIAWFASDPDYPSISEIEDVLDDFVDFDPSSTNFRYPTDLDGNPSLPGVTLINVAQMQDRANRLLARLHAIEAAFDVDRT